MNRHRVLLNPSIQLSSQTHLSSSYNLHPAPSHLTTSSQIHQQKEELKAVTTVQEAKQIGQELAKLAESTSIETSIMRKFLQDEDKKHQPSREKAGAIITKAEVIGRKALDKAYKVKVAQIKQAKEMVEIKKKTGERSGG
jgi:hypothetical protein